MKTMWLKSIHFKDFFAQSLSQLAFNQTQMDFHKKNEKGVFINIWALGKTRIKPCNYTFSLSSLFLIWSLNNAE